MNCRIKLNCSGVILFIFPEYQVKQDVGADYVYTVGIIRLPL